MKKLISTLLWKTIFLLHTAPKFIWEEFKSNYLFEAWFNINKQRDTDIKIKTSKQKYQYRPSNNPWHHALATLKAEKYRTNLAIQVDMHQNYRAYYNPETMVYNVYHKKPRLMVVVPSEEASSIKDALHIGIPKLQKNLKLIKEQNENYQK